MVMNVRGNDITIRWDKCTAMLSKAELGSTKDFGSIVLVMTDRCSGHEPELRTYIAPVAEAQPESGTIPSDDSEMDIAPDNVTVVSPTKRVIAVPQEQAPLKQAGEISDDDSIDGVSDLGEEDTPDGGSESDSGEQGRSCDEKGPCGVGGKKPGSGTCIKCHKNKSQKHVPQAAWGIPPTDDRVELKDLQWCAPCGKTEEGAAELHPLFQSAWREEERNECPRAASGKGDYTPGHYVPSNGTRLEDASVGEMFMDHFSPVLLTECIAATNHNLRQADHDMARWRSRPACSSSSGE